MNEIRFKLAAGLCVTLGCAPASDAGSGGTGGSTAEGSRSGSSSVSVGDLSHTATSGPLPTAGGSTSTGAAPGTSGGPSSSESGDVHVPCGDVVHEGDLVITDDTVPEDVAGITDVVGSVTVYETSSLVDLSMLADLQCVTSLAIRFTVGLISLDGLENVRRAGALRLEYNADLERADALIGVEEVRGFVITGNPALATMPRFANEVSLGWEGGAHVTIGGGNGFTDLDPLLEMTGLTVDPRLGDFQIKIEEDATLEDAGGIAAFVGTPGVIRIWFRDLPALQRIDLTGYDALEQLDVSDVPALETIVAPDLETIGVLELHDLGVVPDLTGFSALQTADDITIGCFGDANPVIEDFTGLEGLQSTGRLRVVGLPALATMSPLSSALDVSTVILVENGALPETDAEAFVDEVAPDDWAVCSNLGDPDPCGEFYGFQVCSVGI